MLFELINFINALIYGFNKLCFEWWFFVQAKTLPLPTFLYRQPEIFCGLFTEKFGLELKWKRTYKKGSLCECVNLRKLFW
jgi:hypothetical protein